jgi:HKD family nuclease
MAEGYSVKLDVIQNSGPDNLRDTLKANFARVSEVSIAVAFVTQSGLKEILQSLRQVAVKGHVRLLTGLYQKVTEPQALRTLLRVQDETRGRFAVHLSREPQFHWKLYLLKSRSDSTLIVGSSNLTQEGMRSGGELNVMTGLPTGSLSVRKITQAFENDWQHQAVELTADQIIEYEKARPKSPRWENFTGGQLAKILGATPSHQQANHDNEDKSYWRDCVDSYVKKRTMQVVSENTNWDDQDWGYFGPGRFHRYKIGDRIFLFDFTDRRLELVEVRDIAHTKVATPDGRHFVAYKPLSKTTRRFSKKLWASLENEGITPTNAVYRRNINSTKAESLRLLMRPPKKRRRKQ